MSNKELTASIRKLKKIQAQIESATQEAEAIKDMIKSHMGDTEELRAGEYKVTWKSVTSARFDSTAFKKTHGDLYQQYAKESVTRRFCVV